MLLQEVLAAIKEFPNGKASVPDGFGIEFYRAYTVKVAHLLRMLKESFKNKKLPKSLYTAHISLTLKIQRRDRQIIVQTYIPPQLRLKGCH